MTRFAGNGQVLTLHGSKGSRLRMLCRRVVSNDFLTKRAQRRHVEALAQWVQAFPAGVTRFNDSDVTELLGYLRFMERGEAVERMLLASEFLSVAEDADLSDEERDDALEAFRSCIADAIRADAEAAGR